MPRFTKILRLVAAAACLCAVAGGQNSATNGPAFGKWEFTGKDNTGVTWTGSLTIAKMDPDILDPQKYPWMCDLDVSPSDPSKGTKGLQAGCEWDAGARTLTFGKAWPPTNVYTAVLSADGKSLAQGKWTDRSFDAKRGDVGPVTGSGQWTAKFVK